MIGWAELQAGLLPWVLAGGGIMLRLIGVVLAMPLFRMRLIPVRMRAVFVFQLTIMLLLGLGMPRPDTDIGVLGWLLFLGAEAFVGYGLGMIVRVLLAVAEGLGRLISQSIGLGFASFVDPSFGDASDVTSRMTTLFVAALFVASDTHLEVISAVFGTFHIIELGEASVLFSASTTLALSTLGSDFFQMSLNLAGPVLAVTLMVFTILAAVTRVAPQMNLFAFGFILTIPVGFIILVAEIPQLSVILSSEFDQLPRRLLEWAATGR